MKPCQIDVPLPERNPAVLTLPTPLTSELLCNLEQSLACTLQRLRRSLSVDALDPGLVEYASWLPERRQ